MKQTITTWFLRGLVSVAVSVCGQPLFAQATTDVVAQFEERIDTYGKSVQFALSSPAAGSAVVNVSYSLAGNTVPVEVSVNDGQFVTMVDFASTGGWHQNRNTPITVSLTAGDNTIRLTPYTGVGGPRMSHLAWAGSVSAPSSSSSSSTSSSSASSTSSSGGTGEDDKAGATNLWFMLMMALLGGGALLRRQLLAPKL